MRRRLLCSFRAAVLLFFFNDTATTEIYTLSLHDALLIWMGQVDLATELFEQIGRPVPAIQIGRAHVELQSRQYLVCRLLLEKKTHTHKSSYHTSHHTDPFAHHRHTHQTC